MAIIDYQHLLNNLLTVKEAKELLETTLGHIRYAIKFHDFYNESNKSKCNLSIKAIAFLNCELVETSMVLIEGHLDKRGYRVINVKHPTLIKNYGKSVKKYARLNDKEQKEVDSSLAYLVQLNRMRNRLIHKEYKNTTEQARIENDLVLYLKDSSRLLDLMNLLLKYHSDRIKEDNLNSMKAF